MLHTFQRPADNNQRILFDIDPSGRYLATGSTDREALVYDIYSHTLAGVVKNLADAVGGVCFHPYAALLGICTGQRHFDLDIGGASDDDMLVQNSSGHNTFEGDTRHRNGVALYRIGRFK